MARGVLGAPTPAQTPTAFLLDLHEDARSARAGHADLALALAHAPAHA